MEFPLYGPLAPASCPECSSRAGLLRCSGCKVVSYCSVAHQTAHRQKHKAACTVIKRSRDTLEREEADLRAQPADIMMPADVFNTSAGEFWGIFGTRPYMRARFALADALLKIDTATAVKEALEHLLDMTRLNHRDNMGLRDIIPCLMLRLGQEQECYDFLKRWAVMDDDDDVRNPITASTPPADAFEPIDFLRSSSYPLSLTQLIALTLVKLRLYLDLSAFEAEYEDGFNPNPEPFRPIGTLARARLRSLIRRNSLERTVQILHDQYEELCAMVHDANPYFWELLVDDSLETPAPPASYQEGSVEEAHLALYQCKQAWEESEDAIMMIDADTAKLATVYRSTVAADTGSSGLARTEPSEMRRGTGLVFPTMFAAQPGSLPNQAFPATPIGRSQTGRFVFRGDSRKVLVYTDGACANNGQPNPTAGWAVLYGPVTRREDAESFMVAGRLEDKGPFGDVSVATSNRAELRAAIGALRARDWRSEGFDTIIIATDSAYVVEGATAWTRNWVRNGWRTRSGNHVLNRDLWELLLGETERWSQRGLLVALWKIPRDLNGPADAAAKEAINRADEPVFRDIIAGSPSQASASPGPQGPPRIVALCLENEALFLDCCGDLVSKITSNAEMERATTPNTALAMLSQQPLPTVIIDTDGSLLHNKKVLERVIDLVRGGATVVLAGMFSNSVNQGQFDRLFARIGLPWKRGSYYRTTQKLHRAAVGNRLAGQLPAACSLKVLYAKNVDESDVWYTADDDPRQASAVFGKVGSGRVGYVGDVNGEGESTQIVLAMCGLLD